jgi:hypothetical protein
MTGEADGQWFGHALAAGDVNGDGYQDLAISAPENDEGAMGAGKIYTFKGPITETSVGASSADSQLLGEEIGQGVGVWGALATGDVNGDRKSDLLVGASNFYAYLYGDDERDGEAYLVEDIPVGSSNISDAASTVFEGTDDELTGMAIGIGETDGDGLGDLIISSPQADHSRYVVGEGRVEERNAGRVNVIPGW